MIKTFRTAIVLLLSAGIIACDKEPSSPDDSQASAGDGKVEMTFGLAASSLQSTSADAAAQAASVDEDAIDNLWVLQFDGKEPASALALCKYYDASKIGDGGDGAKTVSVALDESDSEVKIYFVANVGPDAFDGSNAPASLGLFESSLLRMPDMQAVIGAGVLPMVGLHQGTVAMQRYDVTLTRMVAKVTFSCSADITAAGETFSITSVQITNVATGTSYKAIGIPANDNDTFPSAADSDNFTDYAAQSAEGLDSGVTWYIPENLRGVISAITKPSEKGGSLAPIHSTCIEVSGDYDDGNAIKYVTYRIYLGQNNTSDFNVIRNYSYTISSTIRGVNQNDTRVVVDKGVPAGSYDDGVWSE